MTADDSSTNLHTNRPSVYLDQWVWSRLAAAADGRPNGPNDVEVLTEVKSASAAGVAFPLSATHYIETTGVNEVVQRIALSGIMSEVTHMRTLKSRHLLLLDQFFNAMENLLGRQNSASSLDPLGVGVYWAFSGEARKLSMKIPRELEPSGLPPLSPELLCRMTQWAETQFLCGPRDEDVERLRTEYGYRPESTQESGAMRLESEELYKGSLGDDAVSRKELRLRIQARELIHEHVDLLDELLESFGLTFNEAFGGDPELPGSARPKLVGFLDSIPSMRISVDMKFELFRDSGRTWKVNDLRDIDALSLAIPYCHLVVADKAAVQSVRNSKADLRCDTKVTRHIEELIDILPKLAEKSRNLTGDRSGWDWCSPGVGFRPLSPEMLALERMA